MWVQKYEKKTKRQRKMAKKTRSSSHGRRKTSKESINQKLFLEDANVIYFHCCWEARGV